MEHLSRSREHLRELSRAARAGVVTVERAAKAWGEPNRAAALRLARLQRGGWVRRIRRGCYYLPPLDASASVAVEDPWVLADELFAPCYVGGWTAAGHWNLTEQLFQTTFVATAANVRESDVEVVGTRFKLAVVPRSRLTGHVAVWRGSTTVRVSTSARTMVDALRHPSWVGGIRHLGEIFRTYAETVEGAEQALAAELQESGNGAAHKRAGYLAEALWPAATRLLEAARAGRSSGVVKLDPAIRGRGTMLKRWGLWVNAEVGGDQP